MDLPAFFEEHPRCVLGFSGGADSTYLLGMAMSMASEVVPVTVRSQFSSAEDLRRSGEACRHLGIEPVVVDVDILSVDGIAANGPDRCYLCKREIFRRVRMVADRLGIPDVIDGTNASDRDEERPGMRALRELGVMSPLKMCGITKDDVRAGSMAMGLPNWDEPSNSCRATRILCGTSITPGLMDMTEEAESVLRDWYGCRGHRVRTDGERAFIRLADDMYVDGMEEDVSRAMGGMEAVLSGRRHDGCR